MLDDYKSLPFITGISILFLIPTSIGAFTFSSLTENSDDAGTSTASGKQNIGKSAGLEAESNLGVVPIPSSNSQGNGDAINSNTNIPIGKYSNSPTDIPRGR